VASLLGGGTPPARSCVQSGAVDELLGVAVEGAALDQFEVEVARVLEDPVVIALASAVDDREDRHLNPIDQASGQQRPVQRQAAV